MKRENGRKNFCLCFFLFCFILFCFVFSLMFSFRFVSFHEMFSILLLSLCKKRPNTKLVFIVTRAIFDSLIV